MYLDSRLLHEFNIDGMWLYSIRPMSMYTQIQLHSCPMWCGDNIISGSYLLPVSLCRAIPQMRHSIAWLARGDGPHRLATDFQWLLCFLGIEAFYFSPSHRSTSSGWTRGCSAHAHYICHVPYMI